MSLFHFVEPSNSFLTITEVEIVMNIQALFSRKTTFEGYLIDGLYNHGSL